MKNIRRKVNIAIKKFIKNEKFGVLPSRRKSSTIKMEEKRGVRRRPVFRAKFESKILNIFKR